MKLVQERRNDILQKLNETGKVFASELSIIYNVSEDTVRRDLREMAAEGLLQRVHGGALALAPRRESYREREHLDIDAKMRIAAAAAQIVADGQVLILDSGTTNVEIVKQLDRSLRLTIITNSPEIAVVSHSLPYAETILIGGRLNKAAFAMIDGQAIAEIERYYADVCFLGVCSLHPEVGYSALLHEEVMMKRAIISRSAEVVAVVTKNKLNTVSPFVVTPIQDITHLVTEADIPETQLASYRQADLQVIQA